MRRTERPPREFQATLSEEDIEAAYRRAGVPVRPVWCCATL